MDGSKFGLLTDWKSILSGHIIFTDGERSAVPTINVLINLAIGLNTNPEDTLEAVGRSGNSLGIKAFQS